MAGANDPGWAARVRDSVTNPIVSSAITELGVEPVRSAGEPGESYVNAHIYRLRELTVQRRIADVLSRLQRTNPTEQVEEYDRLSRELMTLEHQRRDLGQKAVGA